MATRFSAAYRWNILLLLTGSQTIAYIDRVNLSVVAPELIKLHGFSPTLVGVLFSVFNWSYTVCFLFAGPIVDRVRPRVSYPVAVAVWSVATALCSASVSFVSLVVCRAFVGLGEAPMIPSGARVIRDTYAPERRAIVVGSYFAGNKLGLALGIPLSSVVLVSLGWQWVFYVTGALGAAWLVWWLCVYRAPAHDDAGARPAADWTGWTTLLRHRTTWGLMLGEAGYLYIYYVFATWLPGYLVIERHLSILKTGFIGSLPFFVGVGCTIFGGWAADRLIAKGHSVTLVRKGFAIGGLLAATACTIAGALASQTVLSIVLLTLSVASFSLATANINAISIDIAPRQFVSSLVGLQAFGGNVGGSFAPIITGLLVTATGSFEVPLLVTAGVALVLGCGSLGLIVGDLNAELGAPPDAAAPASVAA